MASDSCDASEKEMRARDDENADLKTRTCTRGLELVVSDSSMTELSLGNPGILFILPALCVSRTGLSVCIGSDSPRVHAPNYFITYPSLKRVIQFPSFLDALALLSGFGYSFICEGPDILGLLSGKVFNYHDHGNRCTIMPSLVQKNH